MRGERIQIPLKMGHYGVSDSSFKWHFTSRLIMVKHWMLWFSRWSGSVLLRNPIALWFSRWEREGGCEPLVPPPPPSWSAHAVFNIINMYTPINTHQVLLQWWDIHHHHHHQFSSQPIGKISASICEPWHVISNNVAFWQVKTQTSQCSLLLSLETPNDVWLEAWQSKIIQVTSKGYDQTGHMRRLIWGFAGRTYHTVGNPMPRLMYLSCILKKKKTHGSWSVDFIGCQLICAYTGFKNWYRILNKFNI